MSSTAAVKNIWITATGLSGCAAVALGAIGTHALHDRDDNMKDTWKVASQYHLIHTLALGYSAHAFIGRKRNITCALFTTGMLAFSGACYTIGYMNEKQPYNKVAPVGGVLLMAGWLAVALL